MNDYHWRMTDAEAEPRPITFTLAHLQDESSGALLFLVEEHDLGAVLIARILSLLPDASAWRLTITGDIVKSVHEVEERGEDNVYTTGRGAGHVGARTVSKDDGTFDILISDAVLLEAAGVGSPDDAVANALASGAHVALHEAGHAALRLRGEDSDFYQDIPSLSQTQSAWRKHMAAHLDDNRIEQHTAKHAPSPLSHRVHIGDAIAHFRAELNESKGSWRVDIAAAVYRTMTAANDLIRALTYLSAELGLDEDGIPHGPDPRPDGWDEYVEGMWREWSSTFHRAHPVDQPMAVNALGSVLADLCRLSDRWLRSSGFDYGITDDGEYAYWLKNRY